MKVVRLILRPYGKRGKYEAKINRFCLVSKGLPKLRSLPDISGFFIDMEKTYIKLLNKQLIVGQAVSCFFNGLIPGDLFGRPLTPSQRKATQNKTDKGNKGGNLSPSWMKLSSVKKEKGPLFRNMQSLSLAGMNTLE